MNKINTAVEMSETENHEGFAPGREHISLLSIASKKDHFMSFKKNSREKKIDTTLMGLYLSL